ncbi:heavy-metal-associated domain-containing protein [Gudongella sp. SC589]|jgi:copper chaperone|uniref:heavy-metal-associated domain-containing protein n=1 Tax=Gudongella sp. SC589 TaxID=3385990 RepID=UPI00390465D3
MKKTMMVEGMSCGHCEMAVKNSLKEVEGVQEVQVDLATGKVEVQGDNLLDKLLMEAVDEAGYSVKEIG